MRDPDNRWHGGRIPTRVVLSAFRIFALVPPLLELAFGTEEYTGTPTVIPAAVAIVYTAFKVAQPLRWHNSRRANVALFALDIVVCEGLLLTPGQIHVTFALYSLAPVITAALLLPYRATVILAGAVASYYTIAYFALPVPFMWQHISSIYSTFLVALGFIVTLPYAINVRRARDLQAKAGIRERRRMGRQLHDGLCQTICGLRYQVQSLRRDAANYDGRTRTALSQMEKLIGEAEIEARGSLESLRGFHGEVPFLPQLEETLTHFGQDSGIGYRLQAEHGEPDFDDLVKLESLYICEEALRNVAKHSGANHVLVSVNVPNGHVTIRVADDGRGLDDSVMSKGRGLSVMKERAESVGGSLKVISQPGKGAEILVEVPRRCPVETATEPR